MHSRSAPPQQLKQAAIAIPDLESELLRRDALIQQLQLQQDDSR